jgi:hypothetical protein
LVIRRLLDQKAAFRPLAPLALFLDFAPEQFPDQRLYDEAELRLLMNDFGEGTAKAHDKRLPVALLNGCQTPEVLEDLERLLGALVER